MECSNLDLCDEEWKVIDEAQNKVSRLCQNVRSTLFYVAGYIAKKESLQNDSSQDIHENIDPDDIVFLNGLNRGLLTIPPKELFHFCLLSYSFFLTSRKHLCLKRLVYCLTILHDSHFGLENKERIVQRLATTILSGFVRKENDQKHEAHIRKQIKLS